MEVNIIEIIACLYVLPIIIVFVIAFIISFSDICNTHTEVTIGDVIDDYVEEFFKWRSFYVVFVPIINILLCLCSCCWILKELFKTIFLAFKKRIETIIDTVVTTEIWQRFRNIKIKTTKK